MKDVSTITRIVLSLNGQLQLDTCSNDSKECITKWYFPAALYDVYYICGPFRVCRTGSDESFCLPRLRPASSRSSNLWPWSQGYGSPPPPFFEKQKNMWGKQIPNVLNSNKSRQKVSNAFLKITNTKISRNPITLKVQSMEYYSMLVHIYMPEKLHLHCICT